MHIAWSQLAGPAGSAPLAGWDPVPAGVTDIIRSATNTTIESNFCNLIGALDYLQAAAFIAVGLVYLLYGLKVFKVLVVVNAAVLGAWLGLWVSMTWGLGWWPVLAGAVVLMVAAWPLMRVAVCVMGGLAGGVVGALLGRSMLLDTPMVIAAAVIGMVVLGLLGFVIFRAIVMLFTAAQGSLMTVAGIMAVVARFEGMSKTIAAALPEHPYMLPIMIGVPAAIGYLFQSVTLRTTNK